jgi:uncharacterized protein (TIGR03086 family)
MNDDPVSLYRSATRHAVTICDGVRPDQLGDPTPCAEWSVRDLLDHLAGGAEYLLAAIEGRPVRPVAFAGAAAYAADVDAVLRGLEDPLVLDRTCASPLGFEWPVGQAVAGTFMDVLLHTWDLARATGQDDRLDPALVEVCCQMFLPAMPEQGRAAGLVGPPVDVAADADAQDRLLGAMGRRP